MIIFWVGFIEKIARHFDVDENVDYRMIAKDTEGYTGADLKGLFDNAKSLAKKAFVQSRSKMAKSKDPADIFLPYNSKDLVNSVPKDLLEQVCKSLELGDQNEKSAVIVHKQKVPSYLVLLT